MPRRVFRYPVTIIYWIGSKHIKMVTRVYRSAEMCIRDRYLVGSYGAKDLGAMMALLVLSVIPIIVFYLTCQKYIIEGVVAGAVKG